MQIDTDFAGFEEGREVRALSSRAVGPAGSAIDREASSAVRANRAAGAILRNEDAFELLLHDNWITQHQREMLERPENYIRPVRIREH